MSKRSTGQIKAREEARKVKMAERRAEKKGRAEAHRAAGQSHALAGGRNKYRKTLVAGKSIVRTKNHPYNCGNMACEKCQKVLTPGQPFRPNPSTFDRSKMPTLMAIKSFDPTSGKTVFHGVSRAEKAQNKRFQRGELTASITSQWPATWGHKQVSA